MSYLSNFERSFSENTLAVLDGYSGEYDATLLINCLLGLLVLPKETMLDAIPEIPISDLKNWGVNISSLKIAEARKNDPDPGTLRGLVFNMRHSVAHFRIKPIPSEGEVEGFEFKNDRGLHAEFSLSELRVFLRNLSSHLKNQ